MCLWFGKAAFHHLQNSQETHHSWHLGQSIQEWTKSNLWKTAFEKSERICPSNFLKAVFLKFYLPYLFLNTLFHLLNWHQRKGDFSWNEKLTFSLVESKFHHLVGLFTKKTILWFDTVIHTILCNPENHPLIFGTYK